MKGIILLTGLFTFNALASFPQSWINPSAKFNKNEVSSQEKEFDKSFSLFSQNLDKSVEAIKSDDVSKIIGTYNRSKLKLELNTLENLALLAPKVKQLLNLFG